MMKIRVAVVKGSGRYIHSPGWPWSVLIVRRRSEDEVLVEILAGAGPLLYTLGPGCLFPWPCRCGVCHSDGKSMSVLGAWVNRQPCEMCLWIGPDHITCEVFPEAIDIYSTRMGCLYWQCAGCGQDDYGSDHAACMDDAPLKPWLVREIERQTMKKIKRPKSRGGGKGRK